MDSVVKVRRSFLNDIRGFCNYFASMCDGCYRRPCSCSLADIIHRAKALVVMLDNVRDADEERFYVENPMNDLYDKIVKAIRQGGGRPVRASSIRIPGVYKQKKSRAIKSLLRHGRIEMTIVHGERLYSVCEDGQHTNENRKGECHGIQH